MDLPCVFQFIQSSTFLSPFSHSHQKTLPPILWENNHRTWVSESYSLWPKMRVSFKLFFLFSSPKKDPDIFFLKLMPLPRFATLPPLKHCSINYSVCWIFQTCSTGFFPWSYRHVQISAIVKKFKIKPFSSLSSPKSLFSLFPSYPGFLKESILCFFVVLSHSFFKPRHSSLCTNNLIVTSFS